MKKNILLETMQPEVQIKNMIKSILSISTDINFCNDNGYLRCTVPYLISCDEQRLKFIEQLVRDINLILTQYKDFHLNTNSYGLSASVILYKEVFNVRYKTSRIKKSIQVKNEDDISLRLRKIKRSLESLFIIFGDFDFMIKQVGKELILLADNNVVIGECKLEEIRKVMHLLRDYNKYFSLLGFTLIISFDSFKSKVNAELVQVI